MPVSIDAICHYRLYLKFLSSIIIYFYSSDCCVLLFLFFQNFSFVYCFLISLILSNYSLTAYLWDMDFACNWIRLSLCKDLILFGTISSHVGDSTRFIVSRETVHTKWRIKLYSTPFFAGASSNFQSLTSRFVAFTHLSTVKLSKEVSKWQLSQQSFKHNSIKIPLQSSKVPVTLSVRMSSVDWYSAQGKDLRRKDL